MFPLLTFASGLLAGIVGVRVLKSVKVPAGMGAATATQLGTIGDKARHGLDKAQTGLRQASVSGLTAVEKSSASLREKLAAAPEAPTVPESAVIEEPPVAAAAEPPKAKAARKPTRRKTAKPQPAPEPGGEA